MDAQWEIYYAHLFFFFIIRISKSKRGLPNQRTWPSLSDGNHRYKCHFIVCDLRFCIIDLLEMAREFDKFKYSVLKYVWSKKKTNENWQYFCCCCWHPSMKNSKSSIRSIKQYLQIFSAAFRIFFFKVFYVFQ